MRVLSIEDQPYSLKWKYRYLQEKGHELEIDNMMGLGWKRVLEKANTADVVLLDLMADSSGLFPGEKFEGDTGLELLRRLRAAGFSRPVVILTKRNLPTGKSDELKRLLGVSSCRLKTEISAEELEAELAEIVQKSKGWST